MKNGRQHNHYRSCSRDYYQVSERLASFPIILGRFATHIVHLPGDGVPNLLGVWRNEPEQVRDSAAPSIKINVMDYYIPRTTDAASGSYEFRLYLFIAASMPSASQSSMAETALS